MLIIMRRVPAISSGATHDSNRIIRLSCDGPVVLDAHYKFLYSCAHQASVVTRKDSVPTLVLLLYPRDCYMEMVGIRPIPSSGVVLFSLNSSRASLLSRFVQAAIR